MEFNTAKIPEGICTKVGAVILEFETLVKHREELERELQKANAVIEALKAESIVSNASMKPCPKPSEANEGVEMEKCRLLQDELRDHPVKLAQRLAAFRRKYLEDRKVPVNNGLSKFQETIRSIADEYGHVVPLVGRALQVLSETQDRKCELEQERKCSNDDLAAARDELVDTRAKCDRLTAEKVVRSTLVSTLKEKIQRLELALQGKQNAISRGATETQGIRDEKVRLEFRIATLGQTVAASHAANAVLQNDLVVFEKEASRKENENKHLLARYSELQDLVMQLDYDHCMSSQQSAKDRDVAVNVRMQLRVARMDLAAVTANHQIAEQTSARFKQQRDEARSHFAKLNRVRWSAGFKPVKDGSAVVEAPSASDPKLEVRSFSHYTGIQIYGRAWRTPKLTQVESDDLRKPEEGTGSNTAMEDPSAIISAESASCGNTIQWTTVSPVHDGQQASALSEREMDGEHAQAAPSNNEWRVQPPKHPRNWTAEAPRPLKQRRTIDSYRPTYLG
jgi:hypothetical protein